MVVLRIAVTGTEMMLYLPSKKTELGMTAWNVGTCQRLPPSYSAGFWSESSLFTGVISRPQERKVAV